MPAAFDRCVEHVKGKVKNPYAACNAAGAGKGGHAARKKKDRVRKRADRMQRALRERGTI